MNKSDTNKALKENESQTQEGLSFGDLYKFDFECFMGFEKWIEDESQHLQKVAHQARQFVERRSRGTKHPVWDFLFTYYNFSPLKLMTWAPFMGDCMSLQNRSPNAVRYAWPQMKSRNLRELRWIRDLCEKIAQRPVKLGCHGLHEWAMVYEMSAEEVRHSGYKLRMSPPELKRFVDRHTITCTHYDAFRFFTPSAVPLNIYSPKFETRMELEQGGCLHANMDLYKWSYKLWPWIGSDMVADAFVLALEGRTLDMQASPYDLAEIGFAPILLETEDGKAEYRERQAQLAAKSAKLRDLLQKRCETLLEMMETREAPKPKPLT